MIEGIIYYGDGNLRDTADAHPLNVVFLTSVRDVGTCDLNGIMVETGCGPRYMEGAIERTVRETFPSGALAEDVRVAGIITDDTEHDMRESSYSALPDSSHYWIFPADLFAPDGRLVRDMTYNIPSTFRLLPLGAIEERRQLKREFEESVLQKMRELRGDILVSDHYMARLDFLTEEFGLYGRVLNIHPAVTVKTSPFCFRGKTPTADAIERARSGIPTRTGATLHFINNIIDDGPPIAYVDGTPVFPTDELQWLRYRNYQMAKLPLFVSGLAHYARNIYPYLQPNLPEANKEAQVYENILFT